MHIYIFKKKLDIIKTPKGNYFIDFQQGFTYSFLTYLDNSEERTKNYIYSLLYKYYSFKFMNSRRSPLFSNLDELTSFYINFTRKFKLINNKFEYIRDIPDCNISSIF